MDVLVLLAEHPNKLVSRDQLLDAVWSGHVAADELLTRAISELRHALHDVRGDPQHIETVPKRGYRLIGEIRLADGSSLDKTLSRSAPIAQLKEHKLAIAVVFTLALTLAYFAYDEFVIERKQEEAAATTKTQLEDVIETDRWEKSVAVLPFVNMSDDPGNEHFSDGLSEEILTLLARIPELKVIGRTSSFSFKGKNEDLRVIGQTLGVKTVLEGSVRKSGEEVRITAQLVDVSDGSNIWSETYDRTMTDIFAVQDDVAAAIVNALQIHVGTNATRGRPTEITEAYALFLQAKALINEFRGRSAGEVLQKAIELDPEFAEAYELLGVLYWRQTGAVITAAEGQRLVNDAAAKAIAIDPDLVFAQALYKTASNSNVTFLDVIEAYEQAAHDDRSNTAAIDALSYDLLEVGYLQRALDVAERLVDLDPLSPAANYRLFETLYAVGRESEAMVTLELVEQLAGSSTKWRRGELNLVERQDESAIAHFEASLQHYGYSDSSWIRELVTAARDPVTGQAYLDRRIPQFVAGMPEAKAYNWQQELTTWYLFFGFLDRYFEIILDFDLAGPSWTDEDTLVHAGTMFRRLGFTAHPKYLEVADALGIVDVWEQRGPPDFCEKVGGKWVCE
jgi:TolB-like protein/DNA-binding winged helix-turn-helix (wHTH) protein